MWSDPAFWNAHHKNWSLGESFDLPPLDARDARVYRVAADRTDDGWTTYEFPESDPRAGIQTQIALLSLYAHPGRSSPTLRGRPMPLK